MISYIGSVKNFLFISILTFNFAITTTSFSGPTIATGEVGGTYYKIGSDLKKLNLFDDDNLEVMSTPGSIANMILLKGGDAHFAIAQQDAVEFFNKYIDDSFNSKISTLLHLYPEDIHIVSNKPYSKLNSLAGKTVSCGMKNSGSCLSLDFISYSFGLKFIVKNINLKTSLQKLSNDELDAILITGGQPLEAINESIFSQKKFYFVPVGYNKTMVDILGYKTSTISKTHYKFLKSDIPTLSVQSVLLGETKNNKLLQATERICENIEELIKTGHRSWINVREHCNRE